MAEAICFILEEVTAVLAWVTEGYLYKLIEQGTGIGNGHGQATLSAMACILVVENGHRMEVGSHDVWEKKRGICGQCKQGNCS